MINRCLNDLQNTIFVETIGNTFYPIIINVFELTEFGESPIAFNNDIVKISFVKNDSVYHVFTQSDGVLLHNNQIQFCFNRGITNIPEGDYTCYVRWESSVYGNNDIARFFMKVLPNNF